MNNKIEGYQNKTKLQRYDTIVERKPHGNMDKLVYPKDFEKEKDVNDEVNDDAEEEGAQKKKKQLCNRTKPREVMGDG
jgi:hypothetical protein